MYRFFIILGFIPLLSCKTTKFFKRKVPEYEPKIIKMAALALRHSKKESNYYFKDDFPLIEFDDRDSTIVFLDHLDFCRKKLNTINIYIHKDARSYFPMPGFPIDSIVVLSSSAILPVFNEHYLLVDLAKQPRPYERFAHFGIGEPGEANYLYRKFQRLTQRVYYWKDSVWDLYRN